MGGTIAYFLKKKSHDHKQLYLFYTCLASINNKEGNIWGSIDALEESLKHLNELRYKRDLPVAQTYLNMANAYTFV